ncbi:restriction endonuclease subunit S, partial [Nosocomiicoccus massiliensis]|uniref:restriction endonuclease subunit S n=1 Tax=Nosocomiicoccus massiliensis TaxID=1232430 RepID=UPI0005924C6B
LDRELRKYVSSSARMDGLLNITYQNFEKVELNLPQKYEQLKVKEFLKKLDLLLTLHNKKLNKLECLKKEYLNYLFI